jgi:hypothetical protein
MLGGLERPDYNVFGIEPTRGGSTSTMNIDLALIAIDSTHTQSSRHNLMAHSTPLLMTLSGPSKTKPGAPLVMEQHSWHP